METIHSPSKIRYKGVPPAFYLMSFFCFWAKNRRRSISQFAPPPKEETLACHLQPVTCNPSHSLLSVSAGSIRAIRSAGSTLAAAAITSSTTGTVASVTGSYVETP
jgi:hypothetical protein